MPDFIDIRSGINPMARKGLFYAPTDEDRTGDPEYIGWLAHNGFWIIQELNRTNGTYRYAIGDKIYTTNWTGRAGLTYTYWDQLL